MSIRLARRTAAACGLVLAFEGSGVVREQSPVPGSHVQSGDRVVVTCSLVTFGRTRVNSGNTANPMKSDARTARLGELLRRAGVAADARAPDAVVRSIEYDSRRVQPGSLFVAVTGFVTDGHRYVADVAGRGAVAAIVERKTGAPIPEIVVADTRAALGAVSHEFYGRPSEHLVTHSITGTNGKTTTSYLIDSILRASGLRTGVIGTLGYRVDDRHFAGDRTSPESLDLARLMASMVEVGVGAVTMEVSSHALALKRAAGMRFDTATFTNLSRDHLDFHGSIEEYGAAKKILFDALAGPAGKPGAAAIVNADDPYGREIIASLRSSGA